MTDGAATEFYELVATVDFLGRVRRISILVPAVTRSKLRPDDPDILIGTELLADCGLEIDFPRRSVVVRVGSALPAPGPL